MSNNQKVDMAFEALDLELEILNKSQQQILMGGSDGSSNGESSGGYSPNPNDLLNQLFNYNESPPVFQLKSDPDRTNPSTQGKLDQLKETLYEFACMPGGAKLLSRIINSGMQIELDDSTATSAFGAYNYNTNTLNVSNILNQNAADRLNTWSHELFHAWDDENGGTQNTVISEYQAFLFQDEINRERGRLNENTNLSTYSISQYTGNPIRNSEQSIYQQSSMGLIQNGWAVGDSDALEAFNNGMSRFKSQSWAANQNQTAIDFYQTGTADSMVIAPGPNARQLIADFLKTDHF